MRDKSKILFARGLRGDMSPPEVFLWMRLKTRKHGLMFRRQYPIGSYVLDFYCVQAKLAVEVDGEHHFYEDQQKRDAVRDAWLAGQGIETMRLPADEIIADSDEAAERIWAKAAVIIGRR